MMHENRVVGVVQLQCAFANGVADGFFTQKKFGHDFLYEIAFSLEYDKVALEKQYTF